MSSRHVSLALVCFASLFIPVSAQSAEDASPIAVVSCRQSSVEWSPIVPADNLIFTVSGPGGLYLRQEQAEPRFDAVDEQGRPRPDGRYQWELIGQFAGRPSRVLSGSFEIHGGNIVSQEASTEKPAASVEPGAPENSVYLDVEGRVGIGTSVPGAQLHIKGSDAALAIEDTQAGGHEYRLRSLESGDGSLGLFDQTADQPGWLVDGKGRVGINTTKPTSTLTVDGYIETTKGFLVNGRPVGGTGFGLSTGSQPLATEGALLTLFGQGAGESNIWDVFSGHGIYNSFFGWAAGRSNTIAHSNSFFGARAGHENTIGGNNSFFGFDAAYSNTLGSYNSAFGDIAGYRNTTGAHNSFFGRNSGAHNTVEDDNTFLGAWTDINPGSDPVNNPVTHATAVGFRALVSRSNSVVLGGVKGMNGVATETFVGIGTPSPDRQLVVEGAEAVGKFRRYNATGPSFGPTFLFERARGLNIAPADILPGDYLGKVQFRGRVGGNMPEYGAVAFIASDTSQNGRFSFLDRDLATERMVVLNTGNVGIGTNAPTERLDVDGNLRVRGSIVYGAPAVAVPDYVFAPDFQLMPLGELEHYVKSQRHLPSVPNATEIETNGVNLGEFQMKLLEKIEELTLYTIEQSKVIHRQAEQLERHDKETGMLKDRIGALEQLVKQLSTGR